MAARAIDKVLATLDLPTPVENKPEHTLIMVGNIRYTP